MSNDGTTKQSYHQQFSDKIYSKLQKHVDYLVNELDELSENHWRRDRDRHPRLPLILAHNEFVKETFLRVQDNIDSMIG